MALRFVDSYSYQTKLVVPDHNWNIYGHPANFAYFVKTPLVAADAADREVKVTQKKAHTRRRYVGDPTPVNVSAHSPTYLTDPGRKIGNAIPGWKFILDDGTEKRQFTTTADVAALILYLQDELKNDTKLYTTGASRVIKAGAAEGA